MSVRTPAALLLLISLLLAGCRAQPTAQKVAPPRPTPIPQMSTPAASPTALTFPTRTPLSTGASTAVAASPAPTIPRPTGAFPTPANATTSTGQMINPGNAARLAQVNQLGYGVLNHLAYSADGRWLAAATSRGLVWLDGATLAVVRSVLLPQPVMRVAFSRDSRMLAAAWTGGMQLFRASDGTPLETITDNDMGIPRDLAFSADGTLITAATTNDFTIYWQVEGGRRVRRWYTSGGAAMAISPMDDLIASSSWENKIFFWQALDGRSTGNVYHPPGIDSLTFSPDGKLFAAGTGDRNIWLWKSEDGKVTQRFSGHSAAVLVLTFSPDSRLLASASADSTVRLWNVPEGEPIVTLSGHHGRATQVVFAPDGKTLISGGEDGLLLRWDTTGKLLERAEIFLRFNQAALTGDGQAIVHAGPDGLVWLRSLSGPAKSTRLGEHPGGVTSLTFAPATGQFATGGLDGRIRLWTLEAGQTAPEVYEAEGWINALTFDATGTTLYAATSTGQVAVFSLNSDGQQTINTGESALQALALSADGRTLATGSQAGAVMLWQAADGAPIATLQEDGLFIASLAFSADGRMLAAAGDAGDVTLWSLPDRMQIGVFPGGSKSGVSGLAFSADGRVLAAAYWERSVRLFATPDGKLLHQFSLSDPAQQVMFWDGGRRLAFSTTDGVLEVFEVK